MERHLAAILVADVVGYTRLSEMAEEETHCRLKALRAGVIDPLVRESGGRIVKNTGDGFIATFPDAAAATDCALALQREIDRAAAGDPEDARLAFRMGVNLAEVIVEDGDEILSITTSGQVVRSPINAEFRPTGRSTQGVKFVGPKKGDAVAVVTAPAAVQRDRHTTPAGRLPRPSTVSRPSRTWPMRSSVQ